MTSQRDQPLPSGTYTIGKDPNFGATLQSVNPGTNVVLLSISEGEADGQLWEVQKTLNGSYTIINRGNSLSFEGQPEDGKPVQGYPRPPREWILYKATEPDAYHVVVPSGPLQVDGRELAFDVSPAGIFPPRTWLNHFNAENQSQAWVFHLIVQ